MSQIPRDYKIYLSGFGVPDGHSLTILMSQDLPVQELMYLVSRRFSAYTYVFVRILQCGLYERFDCWFIKHAKPPGEMAEAHKCVAADLAMFAGAKPDADSLGKVEIEIRKRKRQRYELELLGVVSQERGIHVILSNSIKVLKFLYHGKVIIDKLFHNTTSEKELCH